VKQGQILFIFLFALICQSSLAINCKDSDIGKLASFYDGRVLPTSVHAKKLFRNIDSPFSDVELLCLLSTGENILSKLRYRDSSVSDKLKMLPEMREQLSIVKSQKRKDFYQTYDELRNIQRAIRGELWKVQANPNDFKNWIKLAALKNPFDHLENLLLKNSVLNSFEEFRNRVEFLHEEIYLDGVVLLSLFILSIFYFFIRKPISIQYLALFITAIPVFTRVILTQRAPITNMYETVLFCALSVVIVSFVAMFKKLNLTSYALIFSLLSYTLLVFGADLFTSDISLLRPVLRDDFWLSTHVTLIVFSYALLSMSWIYSIYNLATKSNRGNWSKKDHAFNLVKIGSIFLFAGVVLGAVWADKAWGRFWAWDPKETWSLICIVIYMAVIHWNYKARLSPYMSFVLITAAYTSVIMAWFGVNYLISTGLHTYGFQDGKGVTFVSSLLAINFIFILKMYLSRNNYDQL